MRTLFVATAISFGLYAVPALAVPLTCNPAVQNWNNGSQDTCPYAAGNFEVFDPAPAPRPPVEETPVEDTVE